MEYQDSIPSAEELQHLKTEYQRQRKAWKKENRRRGWPMYLLIVILIAAIAVSVFTLLQKSQADQDLAQTGALVVPVTLSQVELADMYETYRGNGDVQAASTVDVYPDTASGKVTSILTDIGQQVSKDQVIMWIDPSRPGQTYAPSPVRSPIAGTVTALNTNVGSLISAQMPVATVGDLRNLEVVTHIPEKFVSSVELDQEVRISTGDMPEDQSISGRISEISPVVDPNSRTLRTVMTIDAQQAATWNIRAGMFVKVSMITRSFEDVMTLPTAAIIERYDDQFVYVVSEGEDGPVAMRREIEAPLNINGISRIDRGLEVGDEVILKGNNLVEDMSKVNIVEEE